MDVGKGTRIETEGGAFVVTGRFTWGDICDLYLAESQLEEQVVVLKIARDPKDNDLVRREAASLTTLCQGRGSQELGPLVPSLAGSLLCGESEANVLAYAEGLSPLEWFTLEEIREAYPGGLDPAEPRNVAWIWRKLLAALGFAHLNGIIHGAVLPGHVLVHPEGHGLILIDWTASTGIGEKLPLKVEAYSDWYPSEATMIATPGIDISMGAACMIYLLGGDPIKRTVPALVPPSFLAHLRGCMLEGQLPQGAWTTRKEFTQLLQELFGGPKFVELIMPLRQGKE